MAILFRTNGTWETIHPASGSFAEGRMSELVSGPAQTIYLNDQQVLVVNQEAADKHLPVNLGASEVTHAASTQLLQRLRGDVLLCRADEIE